MFADDFLFVRCAVASPPPLASYVSGHTLEVTGGADDSQKIVNATVQKYGKINHIVNNDAPGL
ncbi:hypothetical protein MVEN_01960800 [Mycena venus]|uniref:Uncharacterized protein n=1 Tax=Mycena venus TaxID=2733690 RepID=A0A8H6XH66_9AGAR|nr:hypothetical protein MVEN_01960800 [Mycena venus]